MTTPFNSLGHKVHCQQLRSELNFLLAKYGMEANLDFTVGKMKFTATDVEIKLSAKVKGSISREDRILEANLVRYNLRESNGVEKITGFNPRSYKYPFVIQRGSKNYKCGLDYLERNGFSK